MLFKITLSTTFTIPLQVSIFSSNCIPSNAGHFLLNSLKITALYFAAVFLFLVLNHSKFYYYYFSNNLRALFYHLYCNFWFFSFWPTTQYSIISSWCHRNVINSTETYQSPILFELSFFEFFITALQWICRGYLWEMQFLLLVFTLSTQKHILLKSKPANSTEQCTVQHILQYPISKNGQCKYFAI